MRNYSRFRVFLFALAFGLACVWMTRGLLIARNDVEVNLPKVESENVLPVFVAEGRFHAGGGSGPHGPNASLHLESADDKRIVLRFSNRLDKTIYFPQQLNDSGIPYFVECQSAAGGPIIPIRNTFQLDKSVKMLESGSDLLMDIRRPYLRGKCIVGVPFEHSEADAHLLAENNPFKVETGNEFYRQTRNWVIEGFYNE